MKLYDVFYPRSKSMDKAIRLPDKAPEGTRAQCVNFGNEKLKFNRGQWNPIPREITCPHCGREFKD